MRIGFDAKRLFLNNRGLGNYARNLLYGLEKYHPLNEYFLFTPEISNEYVSPILLKSENVHAVEPGGIDTLASAYWRSFGLGKAIKSNSIDLFHGLAQELPADIKKSGAKSVVTIHDMIFLQHPEFYNTVDRWIYYRKMKFAVNKADKIIAISNQTRQDLLEHFDISEDRISVIYQSCNEIFYSKRNDHEMAEVKRIWRLPDSYLLYVGALNENKNVGIILEALARLKESDQIPLVVVGRGNDYRKKMQDIASKNKLEHLLIFASDYGNPSPRELSSFYQMASLFIFPSFYEGFGIPILEARFSGVPVLASNSSGLDEAGGRASQYFDPKNADELADYLMKIDTLETEYPQEFNLNPLSQRLMDLYQSIS